MKSRLLLHVCCGTCGSWVPRKLSHDWEVDLFYFNPNIYPEEEYRKRLEGVQLMAYELDLKLIEGDYDPRGWFKGVIGTTPPLAGLSQEPEGGHRCQLCFKHRLHATVKYAYDHGYDAFATTLTVGRRKSADQVNPIGLELAREFGVKFLDRDWKKGGGEDMSQLLAKECGLYRQEYCGCVYSKLENKGKKD